MKKSYARTIRVTTEINPESFGKFDEEMSNYEQESTRPITIVVCSGGGDGDSGLAFAARVRVSPCVVTVIVYGKCYSAAVALLAAGHKRKISMESWVMVHEEQLDNDDLSGSVTVAERELKQMRRVEMAWARLLAYRTKIDIGTWAKWQADTTYLNADECLAAGLVDEII